MGLFRIDRKSNFQDKPLVSAEDALRDAVQTLKDVKEKISKLVQMKGDKDPQSTAYHLVDNARVKLERMDLALSQKNVEDLSPNSDKMEENYSPSSRFGR